MKIGTRNTVVDEILNALRIERRHLGMLYPRPDINDTAIRTLRMFKAEQIDAMLRIEIGCMVEEEVLEWRWRQGIRSVDPKANPPLSLCGVSVYVVYHPLPACGWRIINPMRVA